jgi:glyoxylase-like metal-dependent hydrolase (beta-lactamase superfamily II)
MSDSTAVYEVLAVRYATRQTTRREVFLNYGLYGEPDAPIGMDYFFWIVRNADRTVLVDCGFDPAVGERRRRDVIVAPVEALARLDIEPGDVDLLIVTHAHYDHIGNLAAFPTTPLIVSGRELGFWTSEVAANTQFSAFTEQPDVDCLVAAAEAGRVATFDGECEPAPGIRVVEVGGHTPGQSIVVVDVGDGRSVVLASDASHYYEETERRRPFAFVADLPAMYRAFDTITGLAGDGSTWVPGHDPLVMTRFPAVDSPLGDLVVRLS